MLKQANKKMLKQSTDDKVKEQVYMLYKVFHIVNYNNSIQDLRLLSQVMNS